MLPHMKHVVIKRSPPTGERVLPYFVASEGNSYRWTLAFPVLGPSVTSRKGSC